MLASKLNMTADNAERWIVNLIREARLDAKIDAKKVSNNFIVDDLLYLVSISGSCCNESSTSIHLSASN